MKKNILILLIIVGIAGGCKYKDGPCISFRSAENRIYGYHTLTKYTVNGEDSLNQYHDSLGLKFNFIYDDISNVRVCIMDGPRRDGFSGDLYWGWELTNDDKILKITGSSGSAYGVGPFGINKTPEWKILKLKANDIMLKTTFNGKEYLIELK